MRIGVGIQDMRIGVGIQDMRIGVGIGSATDATRRLFIATIDERPPAPRSRWPRAR
jgi:hypothetical protein